MKAHIFDIDTLIINDNKIWIIDKERSSNPLIKISQSDYSIIKSGLYKSKDNLLTFNDKDFYLPDNLMEEIINICKKNKISLDRIGFSMREFVDKEFIDNSNFEINVNAIKPIKNTRDHIFIICSKNSKKNYEKFINILEEGLLEHGLTVKEYIHISDNFFNNDIDEINSLKCNLVIEYLTGYKIVDNKFTDTEALNYDEVYFYDDDRKTIHQMKNINEYLMDILNSSDDITKNKVRHILKNEDNFLNVNLVTSNKLNPFETTIVSLEYLNILKTFESFNRKFK